MGHRRAERSPCRKVDCNATVNFLPGLRAGRDDDRAVDRRVADETHPDLDLPRRGVGYAIGPFVIGDPANRSAGDEHLRPRHRAPGALLRDLALDRARRLLRRGTLRGRKEPDGCREERSFPADTAHHAALPRVEVTATGNENGVRTGALSGVNAVQQFKDAVRMNRESRTAARRPATNPKTPHDALPLQGGALRAERMSGSRCEVAP